MARANTLRVSAECGHGPFEAVVTTEGCGVGVVPPLLFVRFMEPPRPRLEFEYGGIRWRLAERFPTTPDAFKAGHDEAWVARPVEGEMQ
jgi:hypothetical protein